MVHTARPLELAMVATQNAFDPHEFELLLKRDRGKCKTISRQTSPRSLTPSDPAKIPASSQAVGVPVNTIPRPTTLPFQPNGHLSHPPTSEPVDECVRRHFNLPDTWLHEEKMPLTGLCNRLIVMSTLNVAQFSNFGLTPFRPMS